MLQTRSVSANNARIPEPAPGEAVIVEKYGGKERKGVIIHPDDFDRLQRLLEVADLTPYELQLTDTALILHELGERGADEREIDRESLAFALGE
jgi:hypothetical protein